jgi:hypothetical protein
MRLPSLTLLIILFVSCKHQKDIPDVSHIKVNVQIHRFDQDFFSVDTNNLENAMTALYKKYPSFLPLYFEFFSPVNFMVQQQKKTYREAVLEYYRNIKPLYSSVQKKYSNIQFIRDGLEDNLRYVKYYYPSFRTPSVLASVESLNPENAQEIYGTTYYHDTLVISLQMFMGNDFSAYDPSQYFDYLRRRFEPQYIIPNSLRAIAGTIYPDSSQSGTLVEQMVEKGKLWYMMDKFLPTTPDSLKTGFTKKQLQWCRENEGNIWGFITKNADLYTVDPEIIQNYIGEAPFTQNMPEVSPGNIGQWVGWQIVRKYANENANLSLQKILSTPAKKIFQDAHYKPK